MKTYKKQKLTIQICLTDEDLFYLQEFGQAHGKTNNSESFKAILMSHKQYRDTIAALKGQMELKKPQETYQEVRENKIRELEQPEDPHDKPEWDFLRNAKVEDPNLKSKIKFKGPEHPRDD